MLNQDIADFLVRSRQCEIEGLEHLLTTSIMVGRIRSLIHGLQRERGATNLFLGSRGRCYAERMVEYRSEACVAERGVRVHLVGWLGRPRCHTAASRFYAHVALVLHGLEELPRLREKVDRLEISAPEAMESFNDLVRHLLAVVFEAADPVSDPAISSALVALLNFMQGKELSGQERACGVMGFTAGWFDDARKARMLGLAANQARSFGVYTQYAQGAPLQAWDQVQQQAQPVQRMRDMAQHTSDAQRVDTGLAELWFDLCTARIDAMRTVETQLAQELAQQCARRITDTRQELDDRRLLLSRYTDHASGRAPSMVFSVQSRILDLPPEDGVGNEMERSILDMMREQTLRMQRADDALSSVRGALDERKRIDRAKLLLISRYGLTEQAAHERLQRAAMDGGLSLADVARQIIAQLGGN